MQKTTAKDEVKTQPKDKPEKDSEVITPQKEEREWLKGKIKNEHLEELFKIIKNYEFPDEAIQTTTHPTMKKDILGYNAQYIINALNEIIGMNHWREYGEMTEEKPASAYVSIYKGTFEIGNWETRIITETAPDGTVREYEEKYFDYIVRHTSYGGSRNMDHWESLKGAKTNFLKKICSYYSLGWKSYALQLDDDFMNMTADKPDQTKPQTKPNQAPVKPQTKPQTKATPPSKKAPAQPQEPAPKKMITEPQINMINKLYEQYLERTPTGQAKTIGVLIAGYSVKELKELTVKQGSEFITQFKEHVNKL